jgi:CheY-like chemotaxis protein
MAKILIVDDDPDFQLTTRLILERAGARASRPG